MTACVGLGDVGTNVDFTFVRLIAEWALIVEACRSFDDIDLGFFNVGQTKLKINGSQI